MDELRFWIYPLVKSGILKWKQKKNQKLINHSHSLFLFPYSLEHTFYIKLRLSIIFHF